jgi:hypothetical protein
MRISQSSNRIFWRPGSRLFLGQKTKKTARFCKRTVDRRPKIAGDMGALVQLYPKEMYQPYGENK